MSSAETFTQVQSLLAQSRAAHLQKQHAAGKQVKGVVTSKPNYPKAEACIREALRLRQEAEALDPEHQAPAWSEDLAANRGVSSAELMEFFTRYAEIP